MKPRPPADGFAAACLAVSIATACGAALDGHLAVAAWFAGFLHYALYLRAFAWGVPDFDGFKRAAVALKIVGIGMLALPYASASPGVPSVVAVLAGIALGTAAASRLGIDRTYYGHEVAGLPALRATGFPYSLTAHPMIVGNLIAIGGTLLAPSFAAEWGYLAVAHLAANLGLLAMEVAGPARRAAIRLWGPPAIGAIVGGGLLLSWPGPDGAMAQAHWTFAATALAATVAAAFILHARRAAGGAGTPPGAA